MLHTLFFVAIQKSFTIVGLEAARRGGITALALADQSAHSVEE